MYSLKKKSQKDVHTLIILATNDFMLNFDDTFSRKILVNINNALIS